MATGTTTKSASAQLWYMAAVLCLTNAVAFIDRQSLPLLVDSIKSDLQVTDTQMSYLIGLAFVLTYIGLGIPAGMLMDKYPRRVVMASGIALWSAATAWCGLVVSYWAMFIGRLGIGSGETVVGPGSISAIRDAFPEGQRNRAIGIWAMGANFGMATALLGGGAILASIGDAASVTVPLLGTVRSWQRLTWDRMRLDPPIPANTYHDSFGNFCHVIHAPAGRLTMSTDFLIQDSGQPDIISPRAEQHELEQLPVEVLIYLLGSRYCETDRLSNVAWSLFGHTPKGWPLVKAICDYV